jgi:hypothetical protein
VERVSWPDLGLALACVRFGFSAIRGESIAAASHIVLAIVALLHLLRDGMRQNVLQWIVRSVRGFVGEARTGLECNLVRSFYTAWGSLGQAKRIGVVNNTHSLSSCLRCDRLTGWAGAGKETIV